MHLNTYGWGQLNSSFGLMHSVSSQSKAMNFSQVVHLMLITFFVLLQ
jgi:hypothetical protein